MNIKWKAATVKLKNIHLILFYAFILVDVFIICESCSVAGEADFTRCENNWIFHIVQRRQFVKLT